MCFVSLEKKKQCFYFVLDANFIHSFERKSITLTSDPMTEATLAWIEQCLMIIARKERNFRRIAFGIFLMK